MRVVASLLALLGLSLSHPQTAQAQTRSETIRGRVTSDSGVVIRGATVSATMAPDRLFQQDTTDAQGRFSIRFANGTGDYLLHVSALGYKAFRKRVTRGAADTALVIDVKLVPLVTQLAAVNVSAKKLVPDRRNDPSSDVGAADQQREGVYAALSPDQEGSLAAIGNIIPGASAQPDGLSVFGLGGSQSNTTLNGMAFSGTSIPRDARAGVHVATSPYDPSRGGFSGGQTNVELASGSQFFQRRAHLTLDAPVMQYTDAVSQRLGQRTATLDGSMGGSGPLDNDRYFYNSGLQLTRRSSDAATFLSVGDDVLALAGLSPDSAAKLRQLLGTARIPMSVGGIPGQSISQRASFSTRFDRSPYLPGSYTAAPSTWNISLVGNLGQDLAQAFSPLSTPTRGGKRTSIALTTQGVYSRFFGDVLNETRSAYSINDLRGTPYLHLPGGSVLVSSTLPDGTDALTDLSFGGNSSLDYRRRNWTWETINETQWYAKGRPHRIKLTAQSRLDGYDHTTPDNLLGQFTYPSLGALSAGQPSSFSRTLSAPSRTGGEYSGFVALSDYWRATRSLQLLYGARLESNRFTTRLSNNSAIASAFNESTTEAPERVHVSPRLGFTWYFGRSPGGKGIRINSYAIQSLAPAIMLRGGIGEFRGLFDPTLLANASASNGLPESTVRFTCLGGATPVPQWESYLTNPGTIPASCAGGAAPAFTDGAPTVRVFDRSYDAPRSWRANLTFTRSAGPVSLSVDGVYSLNLNQPGTFDVNFAGTPKFALANEGGRPVFVNPSSIVPGTGLVSPVDARLNSAFGRVVRYQSDLRSTSRQLTMSAAPDLFNNVVWGLAYTISDVRADARGFDGGAFGGPSLLEVAPGNLDIRHQIQASAGVGLPHNLNVAVFARFMSGMPYTPLINGDVNGDGLSNDRAFVFSPISAGDPTLATDMRALLASAPNQARSCLSAQLGQPAARNSCRGPWTAYLNARLTIVSLAGYTRRAFSTHLNISNPLGGLDQLLHGSGNLQGWGASAFPDPVLLTVRGFDPATNHFRYEVNPRFGSTRPSQQLARVPFRVTVDFNFDLGVPLEKQQAIKLLSPGRRGNTAPRTSVDSITSKLKLQIADVYTQIMQESDSLLLSRDQMDSLRSAQTAYRANLDGHWLKSAIELSRMGDEFDADAAMYKLDEIVEQGWVISRDELPVIRRILSPLQMSMGPYMLGNLLSTEGRKKVGIRMFRM